MKEFFASTRGIVIVGIVIGVLAPLLQFAGNPAIGPVAVFIGLAFCLLLGVLMREKAA